MCDKLDVDKTEDQLSDLDNSEKDLGVKHTADTEDQVALDNIEPGEIPNKNIGLQFLASGLLISHEIWQICKNL